MNNGSVINLEGNVTSAGVQGYSAYEIAVQHGYTGTEEEWVNDFLSPDGYVKIADVIDSVDSEEDEKPLSANQGRVLKEMVQQETTQRHSSVDNIQAQVSALASGSPLVASSTSGMTDTTRTYVNTSDGYWYYYDGEDWTAGGVYQSVALEDGSITLTNLENDISSQIRDEKTMSYILQAGKHYRIENNKAVANTSVNYYNSTILSVSSGEVYYIQAYEKSSNTYGYIFTDDEDNVISSGMRGGTYGLKTEVVKVPTGATKLYSSWLSELPSTEPGTKYAIIKKWDVEDIKERINILNRTGLFNQIMYNTKASSYYMIDASHKAAEVTTNSSYSSAVLTVAENEIYSIDCFANSPQIFSYIFTDSSNNVLAYGLPGINEDVEVCEIVKVPTGATKLFCSFVNSKSLNLYKGTKVYQEFSGKVISIVGDSISTKINKNAVELEIGADDVGVELSAYPTYYDVQASLSIGGHTFTSGEIGTEVEFTPTQSDVGKVIGLANNYNTNGTKTYWELLEENLNCKVNPVCWSGASITSHEGNKDSYKTSYSWHEAQLRKVGIRTPGSMDRVSPDKIIIYRGTNDFSHTPYARIDTSVLDNILTIPETDIDSNNNYDYVLGLCILIKKLRERYPAAEVYLCTLNVFKRVNYTTFPTNNGINSLPAYNNAIRKVADYFGCKLIEFDKDGITFENCYDQGYITDSSTTPTHPNSKGHEMLYKQVIKDVSNYLPTK